MTVVAQNFADLLAHIEANSITEIAFCKIKLRISQINQLLEVIKKNSVLTSLTLRNNKIKKNPARVLAEGLQDNTTLTTLDLRGNHIGNEGAEAFKKLLKANTTITTLTLSKKDISLKTLRKINKLLERNKRIRDFELTLSDALLDVDKNILDLKNINIKFAFDEAIDFICELEKSTVSQAVILKLKSAFIALVKRYAEIEASLTTDVILVDYIFPCLVRKKSSWLDWPRLKGYERETEAVLAYLAGLKNDTEVFLTHPQVLLLQCLLVTKAFQSKKEALFDSNTAEVDSYLNENEDEIIHNLKQACASSTTYEKNIFSLAQSLLRYEWLPKMHKALHSNEYVAVSTVFPRVIDDVVAEIIVSSLYENTALKSLDLENCIDNVENLNDILAVLYGNKTLTTLDVSNNPIADAGATSISELLKKNSSLTALNLYNCSISQRGMVSIADMLKQNSTLKELDLGYNFLGFIKNQELFLALKANKSLEKINLSCNTLGNNYAKDIALLLEDNQSLTDLDLSSNQLSIDRIQTIAEALIKNDTLETLNLTDNNIGDKGAKVLITLLEKNTSLIRVVLTNTDVSLESLDIINKLLERNRKIHFFDNFLLYKLIDPKNEVVTLAKEDVVKLINFEKELDFIRELENDLNLSKRLAQKLRNNLLKATHIGISFDVTLSRKDILLDYILPCIVVEEEAEIYWPRLLNDKQESELIIAFHAGFTHLAEAPSLEPSEFYLLQCLLVTNAIQHYQELRLLPALQKPETILKSDVLRSYLNSYKLQIITGLQREYHFSSDMEHYIFPLALSLMNQYQNTLSLQADCQEKSGYFYAGYRTLSSDYRAEIIANELQKSDIETLEINNFFANVSDLNRIMESIKKNKKLRTLNLNLNRIGHEGMLVSVNALRKNTTVITLILENNRFNKNVTKAVAYLLKVNKSIRKLKLTDCNIDAEGGILIADGLAGNSTLEELDLNNNHIGPVGTKAIAQALESNTTLTTLKLNANEIENSGAEALAMALQRNTTLSSLDLRDNKLSDRSAIAFSDVLSKSTSLVRLDLGINEFTIEGAKALAKLLKKNFTLKELSLLNTRLDSASLQPLIQMLQVNTALTVLNLGWNHLQNENIIMLAEVLKTNQYLTKLEIECYNISDETLKVLENALKLNKNITTFTPTSYKYSIKREFYLLIQDVLKRNRRNDQAKNFSTLLAKKNFELALDTVNALQLAKAADDVINDLRISLLTALYKDMQYYAKDSIRHALEDYILPCFVSMEDGNFKISRLSTYQQASEAILAFFAELNYPAGTLLNQEQFFLLLCVLVLKSIQEPTQMAASETTPNICDYLDSNKEKIIDELKDEKLLLLSESGYYNYKAVLVNHLLDRYKNLLKLEKDLLNESDLIISDYVEFDIDLHIAEIIANGLKNATILRTLDIDRRINNNEAFALIISALDKNKTITTLAIDYNEFNNEQTKHVAQILKKNGNLIKIDLSNNHFDSENFEIIINVLSEHRSLKTLMLRAICLNNTDVAFIASLLEKNGTLNELDLSQNNFDNVAIQKIAKSLEVNKVINTLIFSYNNFDVESTAAIASMLKENSSLTSLDLDHNNIGDEGIKVFSSALKINKRLSVLRLNSNSIGNDGAISIADGLSSNRALLTLNLSSNEIGDRGIVAIIKSLLTNDTLTSLDLSDNEIDDQGIVSITELIEKNTPLINLDLSDNKFDTIAYLAKALEKNNNLRTLHLNSNKLDNYDVDKLAKVLKKNSTLKELKLNDNDIHDDGANALIDALEINTTLTVLKVKDNLISPDLLDTLNALLERNKEIERFTTVLAGKNYCLSLTMIQQFEAVGIASNLINQLRDSILAAIQQDMQCNLRSTIKYLENLCVSDNCKNDKFFPTAKLLLETAQKQEAASKILSQWRYVKKNTRFKVAAQGEFFSNTNQHKASSPNNSARPHIPSTSQDLLASQSARTR